ncbi:MAG: hypothetical protein K0R71_2078 [Bacillales bacterium]|jgi:hypothetical integral membrane protein (TIGR02206 family)|nr:hypothetical protein [Bacillales bacterium]
MSDYSLTIVVSIFKIAREMIIEKYFILTRNNVKESRLLFIKELEGNYQNFGFNYWLMISVTVILISFIISKKEFFKQFRYEKWLRYTAAVALLMGLISEQVWNLYNGNYNWGASLPLSLCSVSAFLSVWTLIRKSKFTFDILFFTGIGGAFLALLHADIKYDFPHITFINFYEKHIIVTLVPIYMMAVHSFLPSFRSYRRMLISLLLLLPFVTIIDLITEGNYWFIMRPEIGPNILHFLWEPPLKIIGVVVIMSGYFYLQLKVWLLLYDRNMAPQSKRSHKKII